MFKISNYNIIAENPFYYLSFPDVIKDKKTNDLYLVYRSGEGHHPTDSNLYLLMSKDNGISWNIKYIFNTSLKENGYVWNCPRLSYLPDKSLNIICDVKTGQNERTCTFKVIILKIKTYPLINKTFKSNINNMKKSINITEMNGMVPDKIIKFKDKLYCANHIMDKKHYTLTQLINYSRDNGKTWFDCNILGRSDRHAFCEGSIINVKDKFLIAYLRDNIKGRKFYKYLSNDGYNWIDKGSIPIYGHRATTLLDKDRLFMSYRNTQDIGISLMTSNLDYRGKEKNIEIIQIEKEFEDNLFHCGYTGLIKISGNNYFLTYYIKKDRENPVIKSCFIKYQK